MGIVIIILLLHGLICAITAVIKRKDGIKDRFPILFILCVPLFGWIMWLVQRHMVGRHKDGLKDPDIDKLKVTDAKYGKLEVSDEGGGEGIVPLEEALVVNDTGLRRSLMLDILHKDPDGYVDLLKTASSGSDVEITHYATTTLLEIQSEYEAKIQGAAEACKEEESRERLEDCREALSAYIRSGLADGCILETQQKNLLAILEKLTDDRVSDKEDYYLYVETALDVRAYAQAERMLKYCRPVCGEEEKWYQLMVRYEWEAGDRARIGSLLQQMKEQSIYISRQGREWLAFWSKE